MRFGSSSQCPPWSSPIVALAGVAVLACACLGGCVADPAPFNPGDGTIAPGPFYADTVIALRSGGAEPVLCGDVSRDCKKAQGGECADNPALGAPDGRAFTVAAGASIDVAFMCSIGIRETGFDGSANATDDFVVHGSVDGGAFPSVQVSDDGTNYFALRDWQRESAGGPYKTDSGFPFEALGITHARFVRIAETSGKGSIQIDSVEALPLRLKQ